MLIFAFELSPVVVQHFCLVLFDIGIGNSELMVSELDYQAWLLTVQIVLIVKIMSKLLA